MKREIKKILLKVRNGGFITPAIQEIEDLFAIDTGELADRNEELKQERQAIEEDK